MTTRSLTFETFEAGMKGMCHRPLAGSHGRKDVFAVAGTKLNLFQYFNGLTRQWNYMGNPHFHAFIGYTPLGGLQVKLSPLSLAQFSGPNKNQGSEFHGAPNNVRAGIVVDVYEKLSNSLGVYDRGIMLFGRRKQSSD